MTLTVKCVSRDLDALKRHWGITGNKLHRLAEGRYLLTETKKKYFFKRHSFLANPNIKQLETLYRVASDRHLVPRMFENKNRTLLAEREGNFYSLQEYVESDDGVSGSKMPHRLAALHGAFTEAGLEPFTNHMGRTVDDLPGELERLGIFEAMDAVSRVEAVIANTEPVVIHGDLHAGNVLWQDGKPIFVDIDSAHFSHPMMDLAFVVYRILNAYNTGATKFALAYADASGRDMPVDLLWYFLVWAISQRIAFILLEARRGCKIWMADLGNQKKYLSDALEKIQKIENP